MLLGELNRYAQRTDPLCGGNEPAFADSLQRTMRCKPPCSGSSPAAGAGGLSQQSVLATHAPFPQQHPRATVVSDATGISRGLLGGHPSSVCCRTRPSFGDMLCARQRASMGNWGLPHVSVDLAPGARLLCGTRRARSTNSVPLDLCAFCAQWGN